MLSASCDVWLVSGAISLPDEVVEVEVLAAVPLRLPDEALAVLEEAHLRAVLDPAGRPFLVHDGPALAGLGAAGRELEDVLPAVGAVEEKLLAVGRPGDVVDVVADDGVVERLAVAHVDPRRLLRDHVVDEEIDDRIGLARLRIRLDVERVLDLRLVHLQEEVGDRLLVEPVVGELLLSGDHHIAVRCASSSP